MSRPTTIKDFGPDAVAQLTQAVEDGVTAAGGVGSSPVAFETGEVAIPAQTPTQLSAQAGANGFMIRVEADCYINSTVAASGGMLLYEGDDIRLENVTDLDQVFVTTIKNQATVLRWMTL